MLLARLRALLRRGSDPRPPVLSSGDVRLDPATREVIARRRARWRSAAVSTGCCEFLLRHPDRVVTKTELLDRVWDAHGVGCDPNTVEVYVGYLRRKLGPGLIETVRGAGYRLAR